jgi:hypothetical protein
MAKSIFETLDSLQTETSVPAIGKNVEHSLPRALFPTAETFESSEKLLAWSNENGFTHALLQAGIQKGLIDCRAKFKSCKKDETWTEKLGQSQVDSMKWEIVSRPKGDSSAKVKAQAELGAGIKLAQAMKVAKVSDGVILASLTPVYGEDIAKEILASLS